MYIHGETTFSEMIFVTGFAEDGHVRGGSSLLLDKKYRICLFFFLFLGMGFDHFWNGMEWKRELRRDIKSWLELFRRTGFNGVR